MPLFKSLVAAMAGSDGAHAGQAETPDRLSALRDRVNAVGDMLVPLKRIAKDTISDPGENHHTVGLFKTRDVAVMHCESSGGMVDLHKHALEMDGARVEYIIVYDGEVTFTLGDKPVKLHAGQCLPIGENVLHEIKEGDNETGFKAIVVLVPAPDWAPDSGRP